MKNYLISLIAFILSGFASLGSAATYNFVDEANLHVEQGYETFDSDLHLHAYMPAAVWLFGTAMLGLLGFRRKARTVAAAA